MLGSRFLWKLYAGYAVVILITAVLVGVLAIRGFERDLTRQIEDSLHSEALLLHDIALPFVDVPPDSAFQMRVWALGARAETRLTVIAADGRVLADSREEPAAMDNQRTRPEIRQALADGVGVATLSPSSGDRSAMYLAIPVMKNGNVAGFVRVSKPLLARERRGAVRGLVVLGTVGAVFAALLIGLLLARSITQPLLAMTASARAVAQGDFSRPVRIDRNDEIGYLAAALNAMTDRLKSQIDTITADRNMTLAILASMAEGVVAVDRGEYVVHINSAAETILGVDASNARGRRIWELTRVIEVSEALSDAMKENRVRVSEARISSPQKDQVVQLIGAPLRDANDTLVGAIVVLHDVSDLRQLESVRRDFVANISHELKTPLAAIRGLVETLIDDRAMDKGTHDRFVEKIRDQSMRLSNLVSDLLTLSRLEADQGGRQFERMDMRESVAESFRAQVHVAETKRVELDASVSDKPVLIEGDGEALRELVDNLLSNAIKYTPEGGRVGLRLATEGSNAVLSVEDTGIGIAPEDQGRIFERFYRVDKARSRQLGGTGLGLSIVKHVALAHGGNISLKSSPGRGSTFRVQIPLARENGGGEAGV
ncbi:MAG: cell wall metabolism sensor histidine kinase WalK [Candidatus Krumholzibacteria bacterium]|nr:cell wall metabolism sensor histidine kinase WalK [Candidatus Krumholzibacteria bacterium]MDH4335827.1 cell wall metabolism sensor histidine kinase WalK [Candidatus Krumholzibacteria bacterium]MDH5269353.1 cell wall metabolism sensor histidine kinase WalK [Candidatus Krumholzibacteria bacterium]MDH5628209.1 cell wall metabolism sensor histidine kinase WalK [Candidatus Krumholzibacteria bacterium]